METVEEMKRNTVVQAHFSNASSRANFIYTVCRYESTYKHFYENYHENSKQTIVLLESIVKLTIKTASV